MIDIHTHILPGFDDGPVSVEESLDMLRIAAEDGIDKVVATPHSAFLVGRSYGIEEIEASVSDLQERSERQDIGVEVFPGIENHITAEIEEDMAAGRAFPLAGTRYFLLELPFFNYPLNTQQIVARLRVRGLIPVLAHPERLEYFQQDPNMLRNLLECGALVQLTADSLTGEFGQRSRRTSQVILEHGWAHFLASDAHDNVHRTPRLSEARAVAAEMIGEKAARALVVDYPQAILNNYEIEPGEPMQYTPRRRFPLQRRSVRSR